MMQLRFLAQADDWARDLCRECAAYVKILGVKFVDGGRAVAHFVDITTKDAEHGAEHVKETLRSSKEVVNMELTYLSKGHVIGVVMARDCRVCASLIDTRSATFISSAATEDDCSVGYKLFLSREEVPALLNGLSKNGVAYKVTEISPMSQDLELTERQLSVLKSAMEFGLYDYPRRITQDELAVKLGIKPSTLNEILRRAEKKALGGFLGEHQLSV